MAKGDDIQERLISFAVDVIKLSSGLPKTEMGRHLALQILRSGTSPAANYGEARGAESRRDFIHKLGIVLKELNETIIWLEIVRRSEFSKAVLVENLLRESNELAKIVSASIKTAQRGS
jgi:four helix bundle protein